MEEAIARYLAAKRANNIALMASILRDLKVNGVSIEETKDGIRWKRER